MKTFTLTQAQKQHDVNRLHDAFIAARVIPLRVHSVEIESTFLFDDAVSDQAVQNVINAYSFTAPAAPVDLKQAWSAFRTAVNSATTVPQLKSALTNELGVAMKELARFREADL